MTRPPGEPTQGRCAGGRLPGVHPTPGRLGEPRAAPIEVLTAEPAHRAPTDPGDDVGDLVAEPAPPVGTQTILEGAIGRLKLGLAAAEVIGPIMLVAARGHIADEGEPVERAGTAIAEGPTPGRRMGLLESH